MDTLTVEGLNALVKDLAEFGNEALPGMAEASNEAAEVVLHRAKALVHVSSEDKRHLRDYLVVQKGRVKRIKGAGGQKKHAYYAKVTFKKGGEHAIPLELGHKLVVHGKTVGKVQAYPFLRPAADNSKQQVYQILIDEMNNQLERLRE